MTNLLNNLNNNYLLDKNLLSYGLLLGSVAILGFSLYYFRYNIFKTYVINGTQITSNNLDEGSQTTLNLLDKDIKTMSNNLDNDVQIISKDLEANLQTLPNIKGNFAQTYVAYLIEKI
jgi:hypothetical protein